jgi:hypothetical protein
MLAGDALLWLMVYLLLKLEVLFLISESEIGTIQTFQLNFVEILKIGLHLIVIIELFYI